MQYEGDNLNLVPDIIVILAVMSSHPLFEYGRLNDHLLEPK